MPVGAIVPCVDNTGAKLVKIIQVDGYRGRLTRIPAAGVGSMVTVSIIKGTPELRKKMMKAIVVRQKRPYRRRDGTWVKFEDNAVIIVDPGGEPKGSDIRGPIALEALQRWPAIAGISSSVI